MKNYIKKFAIKIIQKAFEFSDTFTSCIDEARAKAYPVTIKPVEIDKRLYADKPAINQSKRTAIKKIILN